MDLARAVDLAYAERVDRLVVALTGRTGSGCTTTAELLGRQITRLHVSEEHVETADQRKLEICHRFLKKHWIPFKTVTVSTLIFGTLLSEPWETVHASTAGLKPKDAHLSKLQATMDRLASDTSYEAYRDMSRGDATRTQKREAWEFYQNKLHPEAQKLKQDLEASYAPLFQMFGDNLRLSGKPTSASIDTSKLFSLMRVIKEVVSAAVEHDRATSHQSTRVAIDAIRNPLELVFLREHFASFYAIAISTANDDRRTRLNRLGMRSPDIDKLDEKEYSKEKKHLDSYQSFVSQNLQECIQKADLFFHNPGKDGVEVGSLTLQSQIVRYVALMLRPGIVTPTQVERCMQLAFVAKLNSGCISRQVGAAVSDRNYSIKAVGWNDVPKGQVPCLLRDVSNLLQAQDHKAFSDFEKGDIKLRNHLGTKFANSGKVMTDVGLACPFCFKDAYNEIEGTKNQVHTRSLHAEENAFLQLAKHGNSGIEHGFLYTTASPCELCSKKAYQLGIKEIFFVDPYPGISERHVLASGSERPKLVLFSGAVGMAYHRIYEPIMSIKDEFKVRLDEPPQPPLL